jgi:hypothetical protein
VLADLRAPTFPPEPFRVEAGLALADPIHGVFRRVGLLGLRQQRLDFPS